MEENKIPESWKLEELGNVFLVNMGQSPPSSTYNNKAIGLPFFQGKTEFQDLYPYINKYCSEPLKIVDKDDILISVRAPVGPTNLAPGKSCIGRGLAGIKAFAGISSKFLLHQLRSKEHEISGLGTGTTFKAISKSGLDSLNVVIPPLNEQHRIVAKIEELFSELDNGMENLKLAQKQLKVYRQALLKHAFEGKLTEKWRKENNPEPAEKLLERIKEERQARYEQELKDWKAAVKKWEKAGKKGKKPGKPKPINNVLNLNKNINIPVPNEWKVIPSGLLFYYVTSGSRGWAKYYSDDGGVFIRITNLNFDSLELDFDPDSIQYVKPPEGSEGIRTKVLEGDFLFSITGYLGMFAIAPKLEKAYVNQHVCLARPSKLNNLRFLGYWIISKYGGNHYLNQKNKGAVKAGLGLDDIVGFPIPLCSKEEQDEIVMQLDSQISKIQKLEIEIRTGITKTNVLRQSILKKAFEGKLVDQDPNDEPASELLKRIQEEKKKYLDEQKRQKKQAPKKQKAIA